jgi:hypothetical protein
LREIFFGEGGDSAEQAGGGKHHNYAVLCHDGETTTSATSTSTSNYIPVSSVFQDASNDGSAPAEFRLLDCNHKLKESEKTIAERFQLNLKTRPTIFVSGKVGPPKQVRYVVIVGYYCYYRCCWWILLLLLYTIIGVVSYRFHHL